MQLCPGGNWTHDLLITSPTPLWHVRVCNWQRQSQHIHIRQFACVKPRPPSRQSKLQWLHQRTRQGNTLLLIIQQINIINQFIYLLTYLFFGCLFTYLFITQLMQFLIKYITCINMLWTFATKLLRYNHAKISCNKHAKMSSSDRLRHLNYWPDQLWTILWKIHR